MNAAVVFQFQHSEGAHTDQHRLEHCLSPLSMQKSIICLSITKGTSGGVQELRNSGRLINPHSFRETEISKY